MSSEEPDLPVAAKVTAVGGMADDGAAIQNFVQISEGDELVKRQDAEEAIKEARQQERQKILIRYEDILEEELNEHGFKRKSYRQALERLIDEIADKKEEVRSSST